jgi:hypothetical protein
MKNLGRSIGRAKPMPTPENRARLKTLYGQLADIKARIPDMTGGRKEVFQREAQSIVDQINAIKAKYERK